jgi:hypothetical protein
MKRAVLFLLVVIGTTHCTTPDPLVAETPVAGPTPPAELRRTYWPLDHDVAARDTVLPGPDHYRVRVVTTCLNDSAVVNPITEDAGPALDVSHNYQSELVVTRGRLPWGKATLKKDLFRGQLVGLGPLQELSLSRTAFARYRSGEFVFTTRLGVPDSDLFAEAEVGLVPAKGLRVIRVIPPAPDSSSEE